MTLPLGFSHFIVIMNFNQNENKYEDDDEDDDNQNMNLLHVPLSFNTKLYPT